MDGSLASDRTRVVVVGAGVAGLAAAARLAHAGCAVTVLERQAVPGGKMRTIDSDAGPVDTGPTVLTLRHVFDRLFADLGQRIDDYIDLVPQDILARHFWADGSQLDLASDTAQCERNIAAFAGERGVRDYRAFRSDTARLFDAFDAPMMQAAEPRQADLTALVVRQPWLIPAMAPWSTLHTRLARRFQDPRLAQLYGRYATYVGGSPQLSPALLSLIAEAEARGVWTPRGGMAAMADALTRLAVDLGAYVVCDADVDRIAVSKTGTHAVYAGNEVFVADAVLFNGDPRALALGHLGPDVTDVAPQTRNAPRSLSAMVWAFAAQTSGPDLAHHNVFFSPDSAAEWRALDCGELPDAPTIYVCAQDRAQGHHPSELERFEIILNAPPLSRRTPQPEDFSTCRRQTFQTLARFGLTFDPVPGPEALTLPQEWETRFPGSDGSLYGQSPHGMTAALRRPTARTNVPGLYLVGGGAHPGAGVPMAALSAQHAAEAMISDLSLTSTSRQTAMPGGMSTG